MVVEHRGYPDGILTLMAGFSQAREYAEMIWPLDIMIVVLLMLNAFNILMTIYRRRERKSFTSAYGISWRDRGLAADCLCDWQRHLVAIVGNPGGRQNPFSGSLARYQRRNLELVLRS